MQLSIIIVNWNTRELLRKCLRSIFEFTKDISFEVFVVDNASSDGSAEMVRNEFPQVRLIANSQNFGFAKANNLALKMLDFPHSSATSQQSQESSPQGEVGVAQRYPRSKYVLFMNPDMEIRENVFKKMFDFMESRPDIAISTCKLVYPDGSIQPNIKRHPTFLSQALILLKLHHFFSFLPTIKRYLAKDFDYSKESEVEQIMGAFVFARHDFMDKVKGWDEDYFIWWEDVELCKRAAELGEKIVYFPDVYVVHYEGKSFEQIQSFRKQKRFIKSMLIYFKKHHSFFEYFILWIISPISLFLAYLVQICKIKPRPQSKI